MANGKYLFAARQSPFAGARAPDSLLRFSLSFAGLVVLARSMNPIPSRTRPLNSSAPMVLWLKPWESRSLPDLPRTRNSSLLSRSNRTPLSSGRAAFCCLGRSLGVHFCHDCPINAGFTARSFHAPYLSSAVEFKVSHQALGAAHA